MQIGVTITAGIDIINAAITPAFSPLDLSPVLWLDSARGTLKTGGAVAGNDDPVATWQDQSGNGNHAAQATTSKEPTLQSVTNVGKTFPVIRFDGADDYLSFPEITLTDYSIFIVHQTTADDYLLSHFPGGAGGAGGFQVRIGQGGANILSVYDGADNPQSSTLATARTAWNIIEYVRLSSTVSFFEAGTVRGTGTSGAAMVLRDQGADGVVNTPNGDIAEMIIYPTSLSDSNRKKVEAYLGAKYAVVVA